MLVSEAAAGKEINKKSHDPARVMAFSGIGRLNGYVYLEVIAMAGKVRGGGFSCLYGFGRA